MQGDRERDQKTAPWLPSSGVGAEDESGKALKRNHTRPPRCHSQRRVNAPSRAAEVDKGADFSDGGFRRAVGPEGRLDKLRKSGWLASGNPKCNLFSQYYVTRGRKEMPLPHAKWLQYRELVWVDCVCFCPRETRWYTDRKAGQERRGLKRQKTRGMIEQAPVPVKEEPWKIRLR